MTNSAPYCPRCEELEALVRKQAKLIKRLERRVAELEERLGLNSRNSSKPPSTDPPGTPTAPKKPAAGRKRGAQPGHPRHERKLLPPNHIKTVKPRRCRKCKHPLHGDDPDPHRHQVVDLPPIKPIVNEWRLHNLTCEHCNTRTRAKLPCGVPTGNHGAGLQAVVAMLSGGYRLSKREIEQLLGDLFNIPISLGSVSNLEQAVKRALDDPYREAREFVREQPTAYADDTGWRENKQRAHLWTAVTEHVSVFHICSSRSTEAAQEILDATFEGIVVSDRAPCFNWLDVNQRQVCWAHLYRDFKRIAERGGESNRIGEGLLDIALWVFERWIKFRVGKLKRSTLTRDIPMKSWEVEQLLLEGENCDHPKTRGTCKKLLKLSPALWTFAYEDGVEPTNNAAERAVRKPVLWRKGSFGTDSDRGSRFVERILTTIATLRIQGRNVLDYLTRSCQAALRGNSAPSLLPNIPSGP